MAVKLERHQEQEPDKCSHLVSQEFVYRMIFIDGRLYLLCKSCFGEIVLTVRDWLFDFPGTK